MTEQAETFADQILGFTLPDRSARGRAVRLEGLLDEVLSAHDYPAPITLLLAEALVLGALMGGLLKGDNAQLTMQAQTENGPVNLLVCDFRNGQMRGYVDFDADMLAELGANPSLFALFGKGYLAITFETDKGRRYQGIVPLEGASLAEACENYFVQSEQVPTLLRVAVRNTGGKCRAGGILLQHLPEGEEGRERLHVKLDDPDWEHVETLGSTISHDELSDSALSMEAIVWRLFHEEDEIRVNKGLMLSKGCRCSIEHYEQVIARFPEEDQEAMKNDEGKIVVDCAFCSKEFILTA
ncbi:Chaperone protein Hsp33 [Altererythrobacter epoxidivorans]|uniref:Chaperone protein Hsp33 n=1 Tax=Altererythrobacter epoxidivorans TaxID=361183 RepID=A0A0M4M6Q7_9SPHN|nr:Hsp33 family molecular chaperone HslO [Altererythrobacter epoxidivorans]ALE17990.1 Chaperone protein Hsp33 [Altererythrobacter epoxidivorans]